MIGVYRPGSLLAEALPALRSERHRVRLALGSAGPADEPLREHTVAEGLSGGKFENLNRVLEAAGAAPGAGEAATPDWTIAIDDDVRLPRAFLDRFVGVCEAFDLDLAQPAQTLRSHSAWKVTRRRPASLVRETRFVEIGPVTAFGRAAAAELLPFPELRYGWGLDLHWAAVAAERGWRLGVVDALPVRHEFGVVAAAYLREDAVDEAARFLSERPYLPSERAGEVLARAPRGRPDMRLLFVCPDMRTGGTERHWATLIPELHDRGETVKLVTLSATGPFFDDVRRSRRARGVPPACGAAPIRAPCAGRSRWRRLRARTRW